MNKIRKNFIYNIIYQIIVIIIPIITIPYISRILSADGVGIYAYTHSIVYYFMLMALLGINNYGNRSIAKCRNNKEILSKKFLSIYSLQIIMSIIMSICYLIYVLFFTKEYKEILLIQTFYLISTVFDINWFFFGIEKFKITILRSVFIKIVSLIFIFIFVKNENDIWIYTLILSVSTLISQVLLLPFLKKEINYIKIELKDIKEHIKPCLILFIPVIAVSIYKIMDKIMLRVLSTISEVGYYEQAEKIISIPIILITTLGTVMLPKISHLVAKGNLNLILRYIKKSISFVMFLAFPICFGLIGISDCFIPLFLGDGFNKSIILVCCLSVTILFVSFANVIRTQYLIPKEKEKIYIVSVCIGAIINLILNYIMIPKYQSIGACIGTIFAEFFVMIYQTIKIRKELPINDYLQDIGIFLIKSLIMFSIIMIIKLFKLSKEITIILQMMIGVMTYVILNRNYICSIIKKEIK